MTVTASDGTYSTSIAFNWTVTGQITITNPGTQKGVAGVEIADLQINVTNTAGGTLAYVASGLPAGLTINSSGLISGTIDSSVLSGIYTSTITVSNGTYSANTTFQWVVLSRRRFTE